MCMQYEIGHRKTKGAPANYVKMIVIQKLALLTRTIKRCLIQYIGFCV